MLNCLTAYTIMRSDLGTFYCQIYTINVREHRSDNTKWTIQRNWQHRVHKTNKNKTKS